jgi:N-acetylneuraminic acid mutarotase
MKTKITLLLFLFVVSLTGTIQWTQKTDMPTGRDGLGIGVVNDTVYCIGGWTGGLPNTATGVVEAYDPMSNTWINKSPMPTPRGFLAVCVLGNKIYAIGGWSSSSTTHNTVEIYNPASDSWSSAAPLQAGRDGLGAEVVDGKIYAIGGFHASGAIVEEYDTTSNTWSYKTPMQSNRFFFASEVIDGKIYVAAGRGSSGNFTETWEYEPAADTAGGTPWQVKANIPTTRYHPEASVVNGQMYVCGGLNGSDLACGKLGNAIRAEVNTVEVYDPVGDTWFTENPMLFARRELDIGVVGTNLYAIGGWPSSVCAINEEGQVVTGIEQEKQDVVSSKHIIPTILTGPLYLSEDKTCRIFDITGREVDAARLSPGIYFIEIDGKLSKKVIKVK